MWKKDWAGRRFEMFWLYTLLSILDKYFLLPSHAESNLSINWPPGKNF
jgi:hypothetical protein